MSLRLKQWMRLLPFLAFLFCPAQSLARPYVSEWEAYLDRDALPNGVFYLPPPAGLEDAVFACDYVYYEWGKSLRDAPRGQLAARDANFRTPYIIDSFSTAFGMTLSKEATPEIYRLVSETIETAKLSVKKAKKHHARKRPFVQFGEATSVPEHEEMMRASGSYPSGHTAMGWSAALVLSEINPHRAEQLIARGYEYGESRIIAGYHYHTDVDAGRMSAAAAVAVLHANPAFIRQMEKAKAEFESLKKAGGQ